MFKLVLYYLLYGFLYLLSLLPFRVLYLISDFIYLIFYYLIRYRRKVVLDNLKIAFPEKSVKEREKIMKEFYHRFLDNFIETIKLLTISKKEMDKRFICDFTVIDEVYRTGKKLQIHTAHFFNWEFAEASFSIHLPFKLLIVYMPIESKAIDKIFFKMRSRFGASLIPATSFSTGIARFKNQQTALALVADQNPGSPEKAYWTNFFGRMTPIVTGPEKGSRIHDTAVVMAGFTRIKRGYYQSEITLLTTEPRSLPPGEITRKMMEYVEATIRKYPANYLWSHRRWKWEFDENKHKHRII